MGAQGGAPAESETMDRKYQIFVSSTYEDLKEERNQVIKACLNMGHIPVGMEMFNAADEEQWAVIKRTIAQCDYYVVIVAHRYGSTTPEGVSFTEMEYDYAREQGIPVLGFIIDASAAWPADRMDKEPKAIEALHALKVRVKQKMVNFWSTGSGLRALFNESITKTMNLQPRRGWVRAPADDVSEILDRLARLSEENSRLWEENQRLKDSKSNQADVDSVLAALEKFSFPSGDGEHVRAADLFLVYWEGQRTGERPLANMHRKEIQKFMSTMLVLGLVDNRPDARGHLTTLGHRLLARLVAQEGFS